jgi:hypothetical protein
MFRFHGDSHKRVFHNLEPRVASYAQKEKEEETITRVKFGSGSKNKKRCFSK